MAKLEPITVDVKINYEVEDSYKHQGFVQKVVYDDRGLCLTHAAGEIIHKQVVKLKFDLSRDKIDLYVEFNVLDDDDKNIIDGDDVLIQRLHYVANEIDIKHKKVT